MGLGIDLHVSMTLGIMIFTLKTISYDTNYPTDHLAMMNICQHNQKVKTVSILIASYLTVSDEMFIFSQFVESKRCL